MGKKKQEILEKLNNDIMIQEHNAIKNLTKISKRK